jgi:pimeloyl-ACP methyl ester carboxylesterase
MSVAPGTLAVMTNFVLIPGACHGGWWYADVAAALRGQGHAARPVTLTGLDPDADTVSTAINLDTHVAEAMAAVRAEARAGSGPVVLVGHSYGGSVISAVADAAPTEVAVLVYLDAFVPEDGDSCFAMTDDEQRAWFVTGAARSGTAVDPLPFFESRARPHPIGTLLQASRLTGAWRSVPAKHYVAAGGWPGRSPFADITARVEADPDWTVHHWPTTHNVLRDGPDRLTAFLLSLAP